MAVSWHDLVKVPTKDDFLNAFLRLFRLANFPVASWHSGSLQRHTTETESSLFSDLSATIQNIGRAGFIKYAAQVGDAWVDLCAENVFDEVRKPALYTEGMWSLTDAGSIGPVTVQPGTFWVANVDKTKRYVNTEAFTVPLGGTVNFAIKAESPGTDWNEGVDAITEILTPQPGFVGSNVALENGTWITVQGANRETNEALVSRCLDKWATIGSGSNEGAYRYHALSSSSEITGCRVYSPGGGSVRIILRGDAGPVSAQSLTNAAAIIEEKRPLGVPDVVTSNCIVRVQAVAGTIYTSADPATVLGKVQSEIAALARRTPIGARVSRERTIATIMLPEVNDLEMSVPVDFQLGANEVWVPSFDLTVEAA